MRFIWYNNAVNVHHRSTKFGVKLPETIPYRFDCRNILVNSNPPFRKNCWNSTFLTFTWYNIKTLCVRYKSFMFCIMLLYDFPYRVHACRKSPFPLRNNVEILEIQQFLRLIWYNFEVLPMTRHTLNFFGDFYLNFSREFVISVWNNKLEIFLNISNISKFELQIWALSLQNLNLE